jgi:hypothetical protein
MTNSEARELEEEYYVHRKGTITGNAPAFWAKGGNGYTSYVQGAERFTKSDAEALLNSDPSKWAIYRCKDVDARLHLVFDMQDTRRLGTNEPCGWPFGYVQYPISVEVHAAGMTDIADLIRDICEIEEPPEDDERAVRVNLDWLREKLTSLSTEAPDQVNDAVKMVTPEEAAELAKNVCGSDVEFMRYSMILSGGAEQLAAIINAYMAQQS